MKREQREKEAVELMKFLTDFMTTKDMRFGQLIANLQALGLDFEQEFSTENRDLQSKINNILLRKS